MTGVNAMVAGPPTSTTPSELAVARAVRVFGWSGMALPEIVLIGCRMIPVVDIDPDAHRARVHCGDGPNLDADVLVPALHLAGVLVVARRGWRRALRQARSMRSFGPAGALVPWQAFGDEECRLEFALHGIGLVPSDPSVGGVVVPEPGRVAPVADRWIEETLYRHALDHGLCPPV